MYGQVQRRPARGLEYSQHLVQTCCSGFESKIHNVLTTRRLPVLHPDMRWMEGLLSPQLAAGITSAGWDMSCGSPARKGFKGVMPGTPKCGAGRCRFALLLSQLHHPSMMHCPGGTYGEVQESDFCHPCENGAGRVESSWRESCSV